MLLEGVSTIIVCACAYLVHKKLKRSPDAELSRKRDGSDTLIQVHANKDISSMDLEDHGPDPLRFQRKGIKKGNAVEFRYPFSGNPARLIVRFEDGSESVHDV
jgi:hypothetical protein